MNGEGVGRYLNFSVYPAQMYLDTHKIGNHTLIKDSGCVSK